MARLGVVLLATALLSSGCGREQSPTPASSSAKVPRPSILLITLDTTRADAIGPEAVGIETPGFNALASQGLRFRQAYATVPETLPSHTSMMTGLYPGGHGIHENGRYVPEGQSLLAERLRQAGYQTAAFVSSFILARRFGLARGFDVYDDSLVRGQVERRATETTDAVLAYLSKRESKPLFLWVHYFDPHDPYNPPEPYRSRFAGRPYLGEVAAMDAQIGRLAAAFAVAVASPHAIVIAADHGEGLGDHGESLHGLLLYQSTMHVPLAISGPGVAAGVSDVPVSTRRIFNTILDWAGIDAAGSLRSHVAEPVLGEAMKPFLSYGWQPQVMAVDRRHKSILAGRVETYDVVADPAETRDLATGKGPAPMPPSALRDYPVPAPDAARPPAALDPDARRSLASLGYVSAGSAPIVRKDAPRPAEMTKLFGLVEQASGLFVAEKYAQAIPLFDRILAADPTNLDAILRLASAHSSLGHDGQALAMFEKAAALAPKSQDVRTYLALHYARTPRWERAVPLLEQIIAESPDRLPALEGLAVVRERQGRIQEAIEIRRRVYAMRDPSRAELARLGELSMEAGQTNTAIDAFERARAMTGSPDSYDLELGLLYLDVRRFTDARAALDRVAPSHPEYPMALFKRAQVSVLLHEADAAARIAAARQKADATTRELIARERLFQGIR